MKAKKIAVCFIVLIAVGVGSYFYQKNKQDKSLIAHNQQKFQQINAAAKKSNSAGMLVMASAINKYHQTKGHYPKKLIHLFPEFIPDEPFILTLNWKYQTGNGTYLLKRSIKDGPTFTSMGPDLKLEIGRGKPVRAAEKIASVSTPQTPRKQKTFAGSKAKSDSKAVTKEGRVANVLPPNKIKKPGALKTVDDGSVPKPDPEFAIMKKKLTKDEEFLHSFDNKGFYIWKTNRGIIGFSNIQYPEENNLTIYRDKSWVVYQSKKNMGNSRKQ